MLPKRHARFLTAVAVTSASASFAQAAVLDFNSGADNTPIVTTSPYPDTVLRVNGGGNLSTSSNYYTAAEKGIAGTQGAETYVGTQPDQTIVATGETFDLSNGPVRVSAYFLKKDAVGTSGVGLQIGFMGDPQFRFNGETANDAFNDGFLTLRLNYNAGLGFQTQSKLDNAGGTTNNPGTVSPINGLGATQNAGQWFLFETTIERLAATANTFQVSGAVFNADANGVVGTALATFSPVNVVNASLYNDTTLYAALRSANASVGIDAIDDFSAAAVPEPASSALLALTGGAALGRRRRDAR
jgi:hypothetical protein